ncbi:endonuclease III domain-containing protein [Candidatus Woesearchaeota archaeon]|nr:endonuclease III domain-containing protein [Candidatus Woesearchaeota archaeon]MBI3037417.1 endonuclease III domain-containing protein [Candidatus Woesearchaeota archaeon]
MGELVTVAYELLASKLGPQNWWPTTTAARETEVIIGAILTQNTSWKNVEKAIANLAAAGMVDFRKIAAAKKEKIAGLIKSSGYFNQKAEWLRLFAQHVCSNYNGDVKLLLEKGVNELRAELLQLKGIGPETADSILLYAGGKEAFVIDAYTKRIFSRIGTCDERISYHGLQRLVTESLPAEMRTVAVFNQYHAMLVELGKGTCIKRNPLCHACPLLGCCRYGKSSLKTTSFK